MNTKTRNFGKVECVFDGLQCVFPERRPSVADESRAQIENEDGWLRIEGFEQKLATWNQDLLAEKSPQGLETAMSCTPTVAVK